MTNSYSVKLKSSTPKFKVTVSSEASQVAGTFSTLSDVNVTGVSDKYVIMYDAVTQKYTAVNPDDVLTASVTETVSPGIPAPFIDELDVDLDNKIDLDAGTF
jgi:hypothetical protein